MPKPVINMHCHFLNFDYIPDELTYLLVKRGNKLGIGFDESLIKLFVSQNLKGKNLAEAGAIILKSMLPQDLKDFLMSFTRKITQVGDDYVKSMQGHFTQVDICVPYMMDLAPGVGFNDDDCPLSSIGMFNYENYIQDMSDSVKNNPWKIMPFIAFDPRRPDSVEKCIKAIGQRGFVGIKIYPAMGFSPYWEHNRGNDSTPEMKKILDKTLRSSKIKKTDADYGVKIKEFREMVAKNLENMYDFCSVNKIPITVHSSIGGSYDIAISDKEAQALTNPQNWEKVLKDERFKDKGLKINFAHFGGRYLGSVFSKKDMDETSKIFAEKIIEYLLNENKIYHGEFFTDVSCHERAFEMQQDYFKDLNYVSSLPKFQNKFLYGTDYPFSLIHFSKDVRDLLNYTIVFRQNLSSCGVERLMQDNPAKFLFVDKEIPQNYISFLRENAALSVIPDWVYEKDGRYFLVDN